MIFNECDSCMRDRSECPVFNFSKPEYCPSFIGVATQCKGCYYYIAASDSCSLGKELLNPCSNFSRRVDSGVKVSLDSVIDILGCIRRMQLDNLEFCFDSSRDPKNHARNKLLVLASDLIEDDCTAVHPEFFQNYLKTLQPFMFQECLKLQGSRFYGYYAYIFSYPCGTHFIQIKVFIKDDKIDLISFHKSGNKIADIRKTLRNSSEYFGMPGTLVCLQERFKLYLAWECVDDISCSTCIDGLWQLDLEDFIEQFQQKTIASVKSMLSDLVYQIIQSDLDATPLRNKISIYTTLPISELVHKNDVSERGLIAALMSARVIANLNLLDSKIIELLDQQVDIQELNAWLNEYHLFQGDI